MSKENTDFNELSSKAVSWAIFFIIAVPVIGYFIYSGVGDIIKRNDTSRNSCIQAAATRSISLREQYGESDLYNYSTDLDYCEKTYPRYTWIRWLYGD